MIKYIVGISLLAGILISACSKSSIIGSEILTGDSIRVSFSDTSTIKTLNVKADSARSYPLNTQVLLLGSIDDPIFGVSGTKVFSQLSKVYDAPDLENSVLDSVVLSVLTSSSSFWGDSLVNHNLIVYELGESLEGIDTIYTNQNFQKGMMLGSTTFNPNENSTSTIIYAGDTTTYDDIVRVKLDNSFGEMIFNNPEAMDNDTLIKELVNGLIIESDSDGNSVFGMNSGIYLDNYSNKLVFYYTKDDTLKLSHGLSLGGKRGVLFENDFSSAMLSSFFNNEENSDSLIFLSGMTGANFTLEIPYLETFEDVLINYAEIEFFAADLDESLNFEKVEQIDAYNKDDDGLSYIYDLSIAASGSIPAFFGGFIEEDELEDNLTLSKYRINITKELKKRVEEEDSATSILVVPHFNLSKAQRSVIYGPGHSKYPAKLKVTYTQK